MKILAIAPTPFFADRGTHIRILEEARAQARAGHEVTIATYHIGTDPASAAASGVRIRRIRRWLFWYHKLEAGPDWQKLLLDLMLLRKAFHLARTERPDVLHAHLHEGMLIGWLVQKALWWRRMTLVADVHGSLVGEMASHGYLSLAPLAGVFRWIERIVNRMGDAVVASSWENQHYLQPMRSDAVAVLADGVDTAAYDGLPPRSVLRARYGVPADAFVVVYTGAMVPNKGIRYLLDAIPSVCARVADAHIVLAGFPQEHVARFVARHGLAHRVTIISPLPYADLPAVNALADVGVDPKDTAVRQASGKILQYMGAGLPVVCFDKENNRRYLGDAGMYAADVSGAALANAIVALAGDTMLRSRLGAAARDRAAVFSWDAGVAVFEAATNMANIHKMTI